MMGTVNKFLKQNKIKKENTTYPATKSIRDENGDPVLWTIRPISTKEYEQMKEDCTEEVPVKGGKKRRTVSYRPRINANKLISQLICASVVDPDLYDKSLQDSYGVMKPEDLVTELIDDPGEYADFAAFIQEFNGFTELFEDGVDEVKNGSTEAKTETAK